ncbi:unnamed protein product, partial [marine sediment metagenome]
SAVCGDCFEKIFIRCEAKVDEILNKKGDL